MRAHSRGEKKRGGSSPLRVFPLVKRSTKNSPKKKIHPPLQKKKPNRACHVGGSVEERGGSVAERLERWTCNPTLRVQAPP